jgi:hypothetical protein
MTHANILAWYLAQCLENVHRQIGRGIDNLAEDGSLPDCGDCLDTIR